MSSFFTGNSGLGSLAGLAQQMASQVEKRIDKVLEIEENHNANQIQHQNIDYNQDEIQKDLLENHLGDKNHLKDKSSLDSLVESGEKATAATSWWGLDALQQLPSLASSTSAMVAGVASSVATSTTSSPQPQKQPSKPIAQLKQKTAKINTTAANGGENGHSAEGEEQTLSAVATPSESSGDLVQAQQAKLEVQTSGENQGDPFFSDFLGDSTSSPKPSPKKPTPGKTLTEKPSTPSSSKSSPASAAAPKIKRQASDMTQEGVQAPTSQTPSAHTTPMPSEPSSPSNSEPAPPAATSPGALQDVQEGPKVSADQGVHHATPENSDSDSSNVFQRTDLEKVLEKLSQREKQVIHLTEESAMLHETIRTLQSQLDEKSISLTQDADERTQALVKEKEVFAQKLRSSKMEYDSSMRQKDLELKELKDTLQGLYAEGEKMSQEQGKDRKKIKEMKAKETKLEKDKTEVAERLEQANKRIESLQLDLKAAERYKESGIKAQEISESHIRRITELEGQLKESSIREGTIKTSLDRAFKEISELRKENLESVNKAQSEALELEIKKNEELHRSIEANKRAVEDREAGLRRELIELRASVQRVEDQAGWREDNLRRELASIQHKLQAAEARNDELAAGAEDMSQPLLRQIDALQSQSMANAKNWQQLEISLTQQLQQAQADRSAAIEKERLLQEQVTELMNKMAAVNSQLSTERQSKAVLVEELEVEKKRSLDYEGKYNQLFAKIETERFTQNRQLEEVKANYQKLLRRQIEEEKESWERKLEEDLKRHRESWERDATEKKSANQPPASSASPVKFQKVPSQSSLEEGEGEQLSAFDKHQPAALDPSVAGGALAVEKLMASIKRKDEEVETVRDQLRSLTQSRDGIAEELLKESQAKEKLQQELDSLLALRKEMEELSGRYHAALELLGEKTEEVNELRHDLQDVKQIFREQITELLDKIEQLSKDTALQKQEPSQQ